MISQTWARVRGLVLVRGIVGTKHILGYIYNSYNKLLIVHQCTSITTTTISNSELIGANVVHVTSCGHRSSTTFLAEILLSLLKGKSCERSSKLSIVANHEGNQLNPQLSVGWQPYSDNSIQLALNKHAYIYIVNLFPT